MTGQSSGILVIAGRDVSGSELGLDRPSRVRVHLPWVARTRLSSERREHARRRPASRHLILFLAANPSDSTRLALDAECAAIERELRMTLGRDDFDFRSKWAVNIDEMMRHLNEYQPTIVHFSGHGRSRGGVEAAEGTGICLQDERQYVSERALAQMIASAAPSTRVVVLNACFSVALAESLRNLVDCVVGMNGAISDDAARSFAVGFYRALGNRRSIGNAIAQAIATLAAKRLPDEHIPVCRTRDGVNADRLFLPTSC
jgi:hypothetical protein